MFQPSAKWVPATVWKGVLVGLAAVMILGGCGNGNQDSAGDPEKNAGPEVMAQDETKGKAAADGNVSDNSSSAENKVDVEIVSGTSSEHAPKDQGASDVWLQGSAKIEQDQIVISGTSNLVPGAKIEAEIDAAGYTMFGYRKQAEINNDGTFEMDIKRPDIKEGTLEITISFKPDQQSADLEPYGANGEKMTGTFIHQVEEENRTLHKAVTYIYMDAAAEIGSEWKSENPVGEKPDDYGNPAIWMKPEVNAEEGFYLIKVKSNLLEGTVVSGDIDIPDHVHFGYGEKTQVLPDGSFQVRAKQPKKNVGSFYLVLQFKPDENLSKSALAAYGKLGEKLSGDLVKTEQTDEGALKYIELRMKVDPNK